MQADLPAALRRLFLVTGILALVSVPRLNAQENKPADPKASGPGFYQFVNATGGKFTDAQISWTLDGKTYKTLAEAKEAPAKIGPGGRLYVKMEIPGIAGAKAESYSDFIEFTQGNAGWFGNTTQVDAFVIPLTIEIFDADGTSHKVGMDQSRKALFEAFKKGAPKEFQSCIQGTQRIISPHMADFQKEKANGAYFDKYLDEVWQMFATEKQTPGGWTGKVVDGSLIFSKPGTKDFVLPKKPTTQEALLGSGELGRLPVFCAAINRHVLADPGDWNNPAAYYKAEPYNFYAKFWHEHALNGKAYGFCYDDVAQQDTLIHAAKPVKLVVTIYWDNPPAKQP
jgi:hypothetical protein